MDAVCLAPGGVRLDFEGRDVAAVLADVPAVAGVAQIVGADGRPLVTARAANLRRWALTKLGPPKPAAPGRRPPTDLRAVARGWRHTCTRSPFEQRLVFERWMAASLPPGARRPDLKPPVYLHLDVDARFPRVSLRGSESPSPALFGPLRDKRAAEQASKALHKLFALRPCDYAFEPDPALPLGLGCFYAQVRTCVAPCLQRVSEDEYRALARRAAAFLADPDVRAAQACDWLPAWVSAADTPALVVERTRAGIELYPLRAGAVLEEHAWRADGEDALERLPDAAGALSQALTCDAVPAGRDDRAWLAAYLHARPRTTTYLVVRAPEDVRALAERLRATVHGN